MNWLWAWFWNLMPTWAWVALGVAAAVVAWRLLGWKGVVAVLAVTFGSVAYSRGIKTGSGAERAKQDAVDDKARDTITETRNDVRSKSDVELDRETDRWTKP
jgi:hypothetical protein